MDKQLLMKINRAAFEIGMNTEHDVHVSFFTKTNTLQVQIYRGGFGFDNEPETMSSIFTKPEAILFSLLSLLNEKEEAA